MGNGNFESKWLMTFTSEALLVAPFEWWARQAAPLRPIFILRGAASSMATPQDDLLSNSFSNLLEWP
ncbi:MAG: hypothetical protein ACRD06_02110 [Terriglobia bacterium]